MQTVTVPKKEYDALKKKASLYEKVLRVLPEKFFGIERYSEKRMKEFQKGDSLDAEVKKRAKQLLASR